MESVNSSYLSSQVFYSHVIGWTGQPNTYLYQICFYVEHKRCIDFYQLKRSQQNKNNVKDGDQSVARVQLLLSLQLAVSYTLILYFFLLCLSLFLSTSRASLSCNLCQTYTLTLFSLFLVLFSPSRFVLLCHSLFLFTLNSLSPLLAYSPPLPFHPSLSSVLRLLRTYSDSMNIVRQSKFRHVFCKPVKHEACMSDIKVNLKLSLSL